MRFASEPPGVEGVARLVASRSRSLIDDSDLDVVLDRVGDARHVLIGEASHGTSEFYQWRERITRRLVAEKGFSFVAVEGDWPDCQALDAYARGSRGAAQSAQDAMRAFTRWPTWMWANEEVATFLDWLRGHNRSRPPERRVGFHGLDVYSLWESLAAVRAYLEEHEPEAVGEAWRAQQCFEPYAADAQEYARATALVPASCEREVLQLLASLRQRARESEPDDPRAHFDAEQNALVAKNAESYYRAMIRSGPESWNVRDRHMTETLERLMRHYGEDARCVVWEHNTHVGDARYTDMADAGMVNVGSLVREAQGEEDVVIVGFGSYRGSVIAGDHWGAPMERMAVPPARMGSWEDAFHVAGPEDGVLVLDGLRTSDAAMEPRGHRAIGVVYDPDQEHWGNYVPSVLPMRYDVFLHLDQTRGLEPVRLAPRRDTVPETYPFGD